MQVNQSLSILFYRKTKKLNKKGLLPLYCRVTIDGIEDEISTSCYIRFDDWDNDKKIVQSTCPDHKMINKKLSQMKTDLERHFDLVIAKNGLATPKQVFESYKHPSMELITQSGLINAAKRLKYLKPYRYFRFALKYWKCSKMIHDAF